MSGNRFESFEEIEERPNDCIKDGDNFFFLEMVVVASVSQLFEITKNEPT